jgi:hypothetical protein
MSATIWGTRTDFLLCCLVTLIFSIWEILAGIKRSWWILPVIFSLLAYIYLLGNLSPGKAIAVLGFLAMIVTFRDAMSKTERTTWIVLAFGLLVMELIAVNLNDRKHENEFRSITNDLKHTVAQGQEQFKALTGGDEFCYLSLIPIATAKDRVWQILIGSSGDYQLPTCKMQVREEFNERDSYVVKLRKFQGFSIYKEKVSPRSQGADFTEYRLPVGIRHAYIVLIETPARYPFLERISFTQDSKGNYLATCQLFDYKYKLLKDGCAPFP